MEDKYVGKDIGIYHVLEKCSEKAKDGHALYLCRCKFCNKIFKIKISDVKRSRCCQHVFNSWKIRRIAFIFRSMRRRCYNPTDKSYRWYGAKGIKVCDEWLENPAAFEDWALSHGYSNNFTIDRIDSKGDYEPSNCRWVLLKENCRRAGKVNWITINNETLTGKQWAARLGVGINRINKMIRNKGIETTIEFIKQKLEEKKVENQ